MEERLQKLISRSGLCSRRKAEQLLVEGRVTVDGAAAHLGDKADAQTQTICVDGKALCFAAARVYIMLHKPRGYTCSLEDKHAAHLVTELLDGCGVRVYPVGRLDCDSEGLLLLTNDGAFMQAMTHPRFTVDKVYELTVSGELRDCEKRLAAIERLDGEEIIPAQVDRLSENRLRVTIHQGKNRQLRRMCAQVGLAVERLKRVREHTLSIDDLPVGRWRYLTEEEIKTLKGSE